jgi:DNA-binding MarR family transcriptional regulator
MDMKNSVIGETCTLGIIRHIGQEFVYYLGKELRRRKIPIQVKHAGLFMILFSKGEKIEFKELARIWRKSKSTLCDITSKYADEKLIKKMNCCSDKRNVYIEITEEGLKYEKDFNEISEAFLKRVTSNLSDEEVTELKYILNKMKKVI